MREIARAARVSKPALYYHFRDKDDLYQVLLSHGIRTLTTAVRRAVGGGAVLEQLARIIVLHLQFAAAHPELVRMMVHEELRNGVGRGRLQVIIARHRKEELALFESLIRLGIERGEFKPVEASLSASALSAVLHILGAAFGAGAVERPIHDVARNMLDVLLNGLATAHVPPERVGALLVTRTEERA
jgi:AcrR family transcriptional regulator